MSAPTVEEVASAARYQAGRGACACGRPVTQGYEASGECLGCYWGLTPQSQAAAKRARKAAKREEDAAKSAIGRRIWKKRPCPVPPMGFWDWWEQDYRLWGPSFVGGQTAPRWRARLSHRRSLPWVGRTWFDSEAQFFRTRTPCSYMTRAWRSMARVRRHIAWMDRRDAR